MPTRPRVLSTTPLLVVAELQRSLQFYQHVLGFSEPSVWGEPPCFAMLHRDGFELMLSVAEGETKPTPNGPSGCWDAYLRIGDVASEMQALAATGCALAKGPTDTFYKMREIEIVDPDGYRWCIAQDVGHVEEAFAGVLDLGPKQLRLVLQLVLDNGGWTGKLDSPDQNAFGMPIDKVERTAAKLQFAMAAIGAGYDGAFDADGGAIRGTWAQAGRAWPLVLRRSRE